jgi:cellulose biosynthesis protein BcsQ
MGQVITFYSYKGGTGRSMLLANIAWLLAANGERVLVIDWDLEAPGLHRYFKPFLIDPDMSETDGLIDAFWMRASRALAEESSSRSQEISEMQDRRDEVTLHRRPRLSEAQDVREEIDLEDYISPLQWDVIGKGGVDVIGKGGIDFIGAGRQGGTYSERVNTFDWKRFYQMGGGRFLDRLKTSWKQTYEFVLIDSRTGVSDTSGICTVQMPDVLVACLTLNRQSIEGIASILESVRVWRNRTEGRTEQSPGTREIVFYPVVTRIEYSEHEKLEIGRRRAREILLPFLPEADRRNPRQYWDDMEIGYRPFYAYEEILAAFGDTTGAAGSTKSLLSEMEVVARRVSGRDLTMPEIPEFDRKRVRAEYALGTPADKPEDRSPPEPPRGLDVSDEAFLRKVYAKEALWRRNKYHYRNLLSQRELQLIAPEDRAQFGRQMSFFCTNSELFAAFRESTNSIFGWLWLGIVLFVVLWSQLPPILNIIFNLNIFRLSSDEARFIMRQLQDLSTLVFTVFILVFAMLIVSRFLAAYNSPKKPDGVRFKDILKLGVLGPLASGIRDYEEQ